jgi:hypothetical protein
MLKTVAPWRFGCGRSVKFRNILGVEAFEATREFRMARVDKDAFKSPVARASNRFVK